MVIKVDTIEDTIEWRWMNIAYVGIATFLLSFVWRWLLVRKELKKDRARSRFLRTSRFGLIEMTRQRQRQSLRRSIFVDCPHCRGAGLVKTPESMSLEVIRILQLLPIHPTPTTYARMGRFGSG